MNTKDLVFNIYIINLDKDVDRLEKITTELKPNTFKRIKAINGNEHDFINEPSIYKTSKYFCPKSVLGCNLSHRLALKTFLDESKKDMALVLEDDAEPIHKNYIERIEKCIYSAPDDWDIIKLDWMRNLPFGDSKKEFLCGYSAFATAYLINKKGANKILNNIIYWHYDVDINFYGLKIYNNSEKLFKQNWNNNGSNNQNIPFLITNIETIDVLNYKILRVEDTEFSGSGLLCFIIFTCVLMNCCYD
uniref:Glycosyl transferase family 25 domain-containing protein n=1 Tax=viral metagenome TaxID=1070528 RepID=A0A6C0B2K6_9ZZZZ